MPISLAGEGRNDLYDQSFFDVHDRNLAGNMKFAARLFLRLYSLIYRFHEAELALVEQLPGYIEKWRPEWKITRYLGVDVGANVGAYSILLTRFCNSVIAVEPNRPASLFLRKAQLPNCIVLNKAASNKSMRGFLTHSSPNGWRRPTARFVSSLDGESRWAIECETIKIDDILKRQSIGNSDLLFVKIDAEGHELQVLEGMKNELRFPHMVIMAEIENRGDDEHRKVFSMLGRNGFKSYIFTKGKLHPITVEDVVENTDSRTMRFGRFKDFRNNIVFLKARDLSSA